MPQGRIVLKQICQSRKLASLKTDGARLLYTWLIPNVDVNGCFSGDVDVIRGQVFTRLRKSRTTVETYLNDLENNKLIKRYEIDGDLFLQIPDFVEKQPYLNPNKEGKSNIPLPSPDLFQTNSGISLPKFKVKVKDNLNRNKNTDEEFFCVFERWNIYEGKSVIKDKKKINWHGHQLRSDGSISPEIVKAIKQTISGGHSSEDVCGAIDNYAKVLLGEDYFWSYPWGLTEFLTRGEEKHKNAPRKWWKFLPDNFIEEHYLTEAAKTRRANKVRGPTPYQLAKGKTDMIKEKDKI